MTLELSNKFTFGENWQQFLNSHYSAESLESAKISILKFLDMESVEGKEFLDIGCGSGLFSFAAYELGASRITSFDVDKRCIKCCEYLRNQAGDPDNWTISLGSILDDSFTQDIEKADIVYSWGVLHHTDDMWKAIENSVALLKKNGLFYIAIYNKVDGRNGSEFWLKFKKVYNKSPYIVKKCMEMYLVLRFSLIPSVIRFKNPLNQISSQMKKVRAKRGMNYWTNIKDWCGGFPYEFATTEEIFTFCKKKLQLELINLRSTNNLGCNEFLFRK